MKLIQKLRDKTNKQHIWGEIGLYGWNMGQTQHEEQKIIKQTDKYTLSKINNMRKSEQMMREKNQRKKSNETTLKNNKYAK